jgi:hypothetical protein
VWAVCCGADRTLGSPRLIRIDPSGDRVVASVPLPGPADAVGLGATAGSVLVAGGMVLVSDPDNGAVHTVYGDLVAEGGFEAAGRYVAVDERRVVWVHSDQRVVGFGPAHTGGRSLEEAGGDIRALAAGRDALWVEAPAGLLRVDFRAMP